MTTTKMVMGKPAGERSDRPRRISLDQTEDIESKRKSLGEMKSSTSRQNNMEEMGEQRTGSTIRCLKK